jgi:hypothetical protein
MATTWPITAGYATSPNRVLSAENGVEHHAEFAAEAFLAAG